MKEAVGRDMANPQGDIKLLFATQAYSMGTDSPNIARIIHIGPPKNIESKLSISLKE